jgi:uracil-DNA glycosylase family 4
MGDNEPVDARKALRQNLETDALFGAKALPVSQARIAELRANHGSRVAPVSAVRSSPRSGNGDKAERLRRLEEDHVRDCAVCHLASMRTQTVFGQGNPDARIVFVGEAPGFEEDRQGLPFVGRAGQLLNAMIERGMGLKREDVYICNVLKCRPPNNRTPSTDEIAACSPYLFEQIRIIQPEVIIALGAPAAQTLLCTKESIGRLRSRFHDFYLPGDSLSGPAIPVMPTYHPAYLLRTPGEKRKAWEDLKLVMQRLGIPLPEGYR